MSTLLNLGTGVITDTDLTTLVGAMPELPCDSEFHGVSEFHDNGPARFYIQSVHDCAVLGAGFVAPRCERISVWVRDHADAIAHCNHCKHIGLVAELFRVVGPVES